MTRYSPFAVLLTVAALAPAADPRPDPLDRAVENALTYLRGAQDDDGGWRALGWAWPAIAFLVFMIPLPFRFEAALAHPLQRIGTIMSTFALQTIGMTAYSEGNVIVLGEVRIGVVEACSGLNMLMTFFALSTGVAILMQRSPLERMIVFVSAVPIALATNILRIIVTASDVIHSWAMPSFGIKIDAIPGRLNEDWFKAEKVGTYFGQCSELCGKDHAYMPIMVQVVPEADFAAWAAKAKSAGIEEAQKYLAARLATNGLVAAGE